MAEKDSLASWIVLAAAFVCQVVVFGLLLCFGIYFVTLIDYFDSKRSHAVLVGSIAYATFALSSPIASVLYRKFGCRLTVMGGGCIATCGMLLSYFAPNLTYLCFTYGFLGGLGCGLLYTPSVGILPDYFDRWRFFATAFVSVGSAVGTLMFSPTFYYLIEHYGWRGSMWINACFTLQTVVCGAIMKSKRVDKHLTLSSLWEVTLFRERAFVCLCLNAFAWGAAIYIFFSMINDYAIMVGISKKQSTLLVLIVGVSNACGRIGSSFIGQWLRSGHVLFYCAVTCIFAVAIFCVPACTEFTGLAIVCVVFGLAYGAMLSQLAPVILKLFGAPRLVNGIGYALFALGIGTIVFIPVAGYIADSYTRAAPFYLSGSLSLFASAVAFLMCILYAPPAEPTIVPNPLLQAASPSSSVHVAPAHRVPSFLTSLRARKSPHSLDRSLVSDQSDEPLMTSSRADSPAQLSRRSAPGADRERLVQNYIDDFVS